MSYYTKINIYLIENIYTDASSINTDYTHSTIAI